MSRIFVIGGPNGAGKTTSAMKLLPEGLRCQDFINADAIAAGLSPFRPESVALDAGRLMLHRIHDLANRNQDFAFETTMAARSFAPFLRRCRQRGHEVHLLFLWLRSADLALKRIASRVQDGGHDIPEQTVRRRYLSGTRNFLRLYIPLADSWTCFDNSDVEPRPIAFQKSGAEPVVEDTRIWRQIQEAGQ